MLLCVQFKYVFLTNIKSHVSLNVTHLQLNTNPQREIYDVHTHTAVKYRCHSDFELLIPVCLKKIWPL